MRLAVLIVLVAMLSGCQTNYLSSKPFSHSYDTIWEVTYQVVSNRYDILHASKEEGVIETDWNEKMALNYLNSYRYKASIKIEDYKDESDEIPEPGDVEGPPQPQKVVKINVSQQQNRNVDDPYSSSGALWFPKGDSVAEAQRLLDFVNAKMATKIPENPKQAHLE